MKRSISSFKKVMSLRVMMAVGLGICSLGAAVSASAQSVNALQVPDEPLVLKARGSFFVGGESVEQSFTELGGRGEVKPSLNSPDTITVNQMYVEYMVPASQQKLPVVMIHGAGLSGKSYDTTPDGRMGWFEYFVRQSHPTYVVDQVGRARSGFNQAILNRVLAGEVALEGAPNPWRFGDRNGVWTNFRFGPSFGEAFPESKFPTEAIEELSKQAIPDLSAMVPNPNPTLKALSELSADLKGAVLISHSQSGHFPMEAALIDPQGIRAIVAVEPGTCRGDAYSDQQIAQLAKVPTLIIYGDYLPAPTGFTNITWQDRFDNCKVYVERINQANGKAEIIHTPDLGIRGNSHMLMQDRNSNQIADVILNWIDSNTAVAS